MVFEETSIKKVCFDAKLVIHLCINEEIKFRNFDDISLLEVLIESKSLMFFKISKANIYGYGMNGISATC